jgi:hypothetical protein
MCQAVLLVLQVSAATWGALSLLMGTTSRGSSRHMTLVVIGWLGANNRVSAKAAQRGQQWPEVQVVSGHAAAISCC